MLAPGLVVWADFVDVPEDADEVEVVGAAVAVELPLSRRRRRARRKSMRVRQPDNPFGMSPNDPTGNDDILVTSNELHLPIDRPVKLLLRSKDVLHDFAVPQFRVKMDLVPGMVTYVWLTPTRTGKFDILCMELCGIAHYAMRGYVVVDAQEDFDSWLAKQPTWRDAQATRRGDPVAGAGQLRHLRGLPRPAGEGNVAMNAPSLAGLPAWYIARQLEHFKHGIRGAHERDEFGRQMAPMASMLPDDAAVRNVTAYIETLPARLAAPRSAATRSAARRSTPPAAPVTAPKAQGNYALQAPRLAGQDDWYLKRQLENFRLGVRGAHASDTYGHQMVLMARSLQNEQSINDLLAYLNTL